MALLALSIASARAGDQNDISGGDAQQKPTPSATSLLEGRESRSNRPFFIQDPTDGLCLSGSTFKRCAVDTLWNVEGEAGRQMVRRMAVREDGERFLLHNGSACVQGRVHRSLSTKAL